MHGTQGPVSKAWVFKDHISGGLMMAFLAYLSMTLDGASDKPVLRWLLYLSVLLALINVLFVLQGCTGQVVAFVYILTFMGRWLMRLKRGRLDRIRAGATLALAIVCAMLAYHAFPSADSRLAETGREIASNRQNNPVTSAGVRVEFYR